MDQEDELISFVPVHRHTTERSMSYNNDRISFAPLPQQEAGRGMADDFARLPQLKPRGNAADTDRIDFADISRQDTRRSMIDADSRTVATSQDPEDEFVKPLMTRSQTIEEADFQSTFKEKDAEQAQLQPRRENIFWTVVLFSLLIAALVLDIKRRITNPREHDAPASAATDVTYGEDTHVKPRWEGAHHNGSDEIAITSTGTGTTSTVAAGIAPSISSTSHSGKSTCPSEGEFLCNGSAFFGICSNGTVTWQSVSNGTECKDNQIVGSGIYASVVTGNAPIQRRQPLTWSNSTSIPTGSRTGDAPVGLISTAACSAPDGKLVCNGSRSFGICSHGLMTSQPVANGTECKDGRIIGINNGVPLLTEPSPYGTSRTGATAWGPPGLPTSTMLTLTTSAVQKKRTDLRPTEPRQNFTSYTNGTADEIFSKWSNEGKCKPEPNRKIGDPDRCFCYRKYGHAALEKVGPAIDHACKSFSGNSIGPAGPGWKQVLASNFGPYEDKYGKTRLLLKMEYWGDVNGNDIAQGGPCLIYRTTYEQCVNAFKSLGEQCKGHSQYPFGYGGYGMDSCIMWTIDSDPDQNNKDMPSNVDGNADYWMLDDPAKKPQSSQSSHDWASTSTSKSWTYPYPDKTTTSDYLSVLSKSSTSARPKDF